MTTCPRFLLVSSKGLATFKAKIAEHHATVTLLIRELRHQGLSLRAIAKELNHRDVATAQGGIWYATTLGNLLRNP